ncbi:MAG: hypothetical protein VW518_01130 [Burkholderiaceae bacterium]
MPEIAYNPETNQAVRLEGNEWIPTDIATNPETGEIAIFDGLEWVIRKQKTFKPVEKVTSDKVEEPIETIPMGQSPLTEMDEEVPEQDKGFFEKYIAPYLEQSFNFKSTTDETAGKIAGKVAKEIVTSPIQIASFATQLIAPETAEAISKSPVGELYKTFDQALEPKLNDDEALVAEIIGITTLAGVGKKLSQEALKYILKKRGKKKADEIAKKLSEQTGTKVKAKTDLKFTPGQQKALKASGVFGTVAGATQAEVQFTPREEETLVDVIANMPGVRETLPDSVIAAADALKVNPEDSDAKATLKQYGSIITQNTILLGALKAAGLTGKGIGKIVGSENLARINTGLGRLLSSRAALPKELFDAALKRGTAEKSYSITIKKELKDLQRLQKKEGVSDDALAKYINNNDPSDLPPSMVQSVDKLKQTIRDNESSINDLLGLSGKDRIGVSMGKDGVYFTRTFEANNNPAYLRKIKEVIKDKSTDAKFVSKVSNARNYFLKTGVEKDRVDGLIEKLVTKLSGEDKGIIQDIFDGIGKGSPATEKAIQTLRGRKKLDKPVLELLGEVSEPYKKLSTTLLNQNKLISELKFLQEVENFAKLNIGKDVELPGLIPALPSVKTTFKQGVEFTDGIDNLEKIAEQSIGRFGGDSRKILQQIYTNEKMAKYINQGLEVFNTKGKGGQDFFAKAAALAQAKETILDAPAYLLNLAGGAQSLIANGHILNPKNYINAVKEIKTLANQVSLKDSKAVAKIAKLRELGVLDQDITGEMISRNVKLFGEDAKGAFGKAYQKSMQKFGQAYGQPDVYTKLIAFESELNSLRKSFPNLSEDELFNRAAMYVRDTMPTYGVSVPAARALSRVPFIGNYVLFPTEVMRTTKNIAKYASKDIMEGLSSGNARQVSRGMARLTGLAVTAGGVDAAVSSNNDALGISENNKRVMNILAPDWAKGSINYYLEPPIKDETGQGLTEKQKKVFKPYIKTRYIGSTSADAFDYLKSPTRLILGKLLGTGSISESEIDDAYSNAAKSLIAPYTSPKFAAEAVLNMISGVDSKTGRPIYDQAVGATTKDKILTAAQTLLKGYEGGSIKLITDYIDSKSSEELLGIGNAQRDSGFPINPKDLNFLIRSGIRPVTANVDRAMGFNLSKDLKAIAATKDNFIRDITKTPYEVVTDETIDNIVNNYRDLQERKYRGMIDLTKKVNEFKDFEYIRRYKKDGKIIDEKERMGIKGVLGAATDNFWYKGNDALLLPLATEIGSSVSQGRFLPDNIFSDKRIRKVLIDRGFTGEQFKKFYESIGKVFKEYIEKSLVEDKPEEEQQ